MIVPKVQKPKYCTKPKNTAFNASPDSVYIGQNILYFNIRMIFLSMLKWRKKRLYHNICIDPDYTCHGGCNYLDQAQSIKSSVQIVNCPAIE